VKEEEGSRGFEGFDSIKLSLLLMMTTTMPLLLPLPLLQ
jgi:hypothetical protein